jgi:hypothetical protein
MKKSIFTLAFSALFCCANSYARVWTVSHDAATPAQYGNITSAIKAASKGDTIYINGSNNAYPGFTVNKPNLTFIGAGYDPLKSTPLYTYIDSSVAPNYGNIYLDSSVTAGSGRGARFIGMYINSLQYGPNLQTLGFNAQTSKNQSVNISRCTIYNLDICGDYWTVSNCVIYDWVNLEYHNNVVISNNIFNSAYLQNSSQNTVLVANNLFWKYYYSFLNGNITNMTFENNICVGTALSSITSVNTNTESYNLTYAIFGGNGGEVLPIGSNSGSGNLTNQDPLFNFETTLTNAQIINSTVLTINNPITNATLLNPAYDFHLQNGSPALTASASSGQIGIYAGAYPWIDNSGMGPIPFVVQMNVSGVIQQGGNINVNVTGKTHN